MYRNGSVHQVNDVFGNRHPQPGALHAAEGGIPLPFEGFKNARYKLLAHADTRIFNAEFVICKAGLGAFFLDYPDADSPLIRIFYGVAEEVQKQLVQAQAVAQDVFVAYVHLYIQMQVFGADVALYNRLQIMDNFGQEAKVFFQADFSAFDMAHIQHVVNKAEHVVARRHDFI